jgi:hypothetical protein
MRTVLPRSAGRASLILALAGVVGSAAFPAVPALARAVSGHHSIRPSVEHGSTVHHKHPGVLRNGDVQLGPAVSYVRGKNGVVHRVR